VYREEEDSILRFIGQVREKNKKSTFFDCLFESGKYLIFVELKGTNGRMAYMGEGYPQMKTK
jgi:hypothetical protein